MKQLAQAIIVDQAASKPDNAAKAMPGVIMFSFLELTLWVTLALGSGIVIGYSLCLCMSKKQDQAPTTPIATAPEPEDEDVIDPLVTCYTCGDLAKLHSQSHGPLEWDVSFP